MLSGACDPIAIRCSASELGLQASDIRTAKYSARALHGDMMQVRAVTPRLICRRLSALAGAAPDRMPRSLPLREQRDMAEKCSRRPPAGGNLCVCTCAMAALKERILFHAPLGQLQDERDRALQAFRDNKFKILVATDVAASGLDITDIEYVINYDCPMAMEDYIHRIGRTGRANKKGTVHHPRHSLLTRFPPIISP